MPQPSARTKPPPDVDGPPGVVTLTDDGAFEALFRAYHAPLCAFAYRMVRSRAVAEELVQEVFLYLWQHRETWVAHTSVRTYLFTATRNAALNHLRRERLFTQSETEAIELFSQSPPSTESDLALSELERAVERAIERLPERCRLIYTMSREQGLSYAEIAEVLGLSVKTVEAQMGRAFKALRKYLDAFLS